MIYCLYLCCGVLGCCFLFVLSPDSLAVVAAAVADAWLLVRNALPLFLSWSVWFCFPFILFLCSFAVVVAVADAWAMRRHASPLFLV